MSLDAHHIPHTGTWLRGKHSGKCYSIPCNSGKHQSIKKADAAATILTITRNNIIPQSYRGHKA